MSPPVKQCTFAGGEITPTAFARSDLALYEKSARTLRNMICMKHGGVGGRPGTMYVGTTLNGGNPVRLIPFIFNETGLGQSYVLEFGDRYIAFYQNGGIVITAPNTPYKVATTYVQADLALLQFAESADIITIVHPNYPPSELKRFGPTNWTWTQIRFGVIAISVTFTSVVGTAGPNDYLYMVTNVFPNGDEEPVETASTAAGPNLQSPDTNPISVTWLGPPNPPFNPSLVPSSYRIYRQKLGAGASGSVFGYVGTIAAPPISFPPTPVVFVDSVSTPDFTNAPPITSPFESSMGPGNYPSTVGFMQQRRIFAASNNNPLGFQASKPGSFANFDARINTPDDDPIFGAIAGEEVNTIQHILELKFALMMTAGAEIYIQGNGSGVVTPSAINASVQSQYGASPLRPLKVGDILIFNQALGSFIRDFAFDFAIDGYRGNDISIFASHLFEGYQIVDWAYQKVPDSIIWVVRSDGVLLSCTYIREQQVLAWARHDFVNGFVENVCSIPENGQYYVYASIRRVINGATVRYIERLSSRLWQGTPTAVSAGVANAVGDPINASFCDCFAQYDGRNTTSNFMIAIPVGGNWDTGPQAYQQTILVICHSAYFTSDMVGDEIFFQDNQFISSQGKDGNQTRFTIQTIVSPTQANCTPNGSVPLSIQQIAAANTFTWSRAVKTISGLGYLAGQKVSVWADRFVVASPLNSHYSVVYTVPSSGILTLDKPYSVIYVGLPIIQDVETLDLETYFGETMMGRRKRMAGLYGYLYQTRSFYAGSENPDTNNQNSSGDPLFQLFSLRTGISQDSYDEPPPLINGQGYLITTARWNMRGGIFMRNLDPVPWTLLAVSPKEEDPVNPSTYKRV